MTDAVKIEGLREFTRGLKEMDRELPKALRLAFNSAADVIVADARGRVPSRTGRARGSIVARSTQTKARVEGGGRKAPYYPWLDFGGSVGRRRSVKRPFLGRTGRYIYTAYFRRRDSGEFQDLLMDGIKRVAHDAGIEVT